MNHPNPPSLHPFPRFRPYCSTTMTKNQHHPKIQSKWLTYSLLSIAPGDHPAAGQFTSLGSFLLLPPSLPPSPGGESQEGVKKANRQLSKPRTEAWKKGALGTVNRILRDPLSLQVINVVGGGRDQDWALVELKADAVCKNGKYTGVK